MRKQGAGDATRKLLIGIFRSGVNTSEDLTWELRQEIQTNEEELDWKLSIYCAGQLEKTSEKIKNRWRLGDSIQEPVTL